MIFTLPAFLSNIWTLRIAEARSIKLELSATADFADTPGLSPIIVDSHWTSCAMSKLIQKNVGAVPPTTFHLLSWRLLFRKSVVARSCYYISRMRAACIMQAWKAHKASWYASG